MRGLLALIPNCLLTTNGEIMNLKSLVFSLTIMLLGCRMPSNRTSTSLVDQIEIGMSKKKVEAMLDFSNNKIEFGWYEDGTLLKIIDRDVVENASVTVSRCVDVHFDEEFVVQIVERDVYTGP